MKKYGKIEKIMLKIWKTSNNWHNFTTDTMPILTLKQSNFE